MRRELNGTYPYDVLSLLDRSISGTLPTQIGLLTNLLQLFMTNNHLSGTLPTEIGLLTSLRKLGMSGNSISGVLPTELAQLTKLEALGASVNRLSGTLPSQLGRLVFLKYDSCHLTINQCLHGILDDPTICGGSNNSNEFTCPVSPEIPATCTHNLGLSCAPPQPPPPPSTPPQPPPPPSTPPRPTEVDLRAIIFGIVFGVILLAAVAVCWWVALLAQILFHPNA